ncbi:hypothetical protein SDC9_59274 [bioreactor metagenome]|uniref:Uncharacterized protein n=1 Tax=bioreactor metagenome TaxID=1076179 RepID=A0A644XA12_9ZZZZ
MLKDLTLHISQDMAADLPGETSLQEVPGEMSTAHLQYGHKTQLHLVMDGHLPG